MLQATPESKTNQEAQVSQPPKSFELPLIVIYQQQLDAYKQQREQAKIQIEQLNGAIFVCENMIKQYEENIKKNAEKFVDDASAKVPLKTNEKQGAMDDGKIDNQTKK